MEYKSGGTVKMKIKDLDPVLVSELQITFDEDPHDGQVDVIVPVTVNSLSDVLGEGVLNLDVHLMLARGNAIIVSTFSR